MKIGRGWSEIRGNNENSTGIATLEGIIHYKFNYLV
jgi:hypothetical protein